MKKLIQTIALLEARIPDYEKRNVKVSNATVGWQIAHSLKTIFEIVQAVKKSDSNTYYWQFNKSRGFIKILNFIPRGKAKAPKVVLPAENINEQDLYNSLQKVRESLSDWDKLDKNKYFLHPFFGNLNKKNTVWFLQLHTKHHLKIINDICNKD